MPRSRPQWQRSGVRHRPRRFAQQTSGAEGNLLGARDQRKGRTAFCARGRSRSGSNHHPNPRCPRPHRHKGHRLGAGNGPRRRTTWLRSGRTQSRGHARWQRYQPSAAWPTKPWCVQREQQTASAQRTGASASLPGAAAAVLLETRQGASLAWRTSSRGALVASTGASRKDPRGGASWALCNRLHPRTHSSQVPNGTCLAIRWRRGCRKHSHPWRTRSGH
mmetsp:Transcript_45988/g.127687  ORF Transcript_45988/g.127687 Transcript_45988/m.127687 type:complete len:220 (+) Transcript_45988:230-889(+)